MGQRHPLPILIIEKGFTLEELYTRKRKFRSDVVTYIKRSRYFLFYTLIAFQYQTHPQPTLEVWCQFEWKKKTIRKSFIFSDFLHVYFRLRLIRVMKSKHTSSHVHKISDKNIPLEVWFIQLWILPPVIFRCFFFFV